MNKFFKKLAVAITALVAVMCIAAFATACDKGGEDGGYATTSFTVTVLGEDGNPFDGTQGDSGHKVKLQFCAVKDGVAGSCLSAHQPEVGTDGKVSVDLTQIKTFVTDKDANQFIIHIINLDGQGYSYEGNYGVYEIDKVPKAITITLNKNQPVTI